MRTTAGHPRGETIGPMLRAMLLMLVVWSPWASETGAQTLVQPDPEPDIAVFLSSWQQYAEETNAIPRQSDCRPRLMPASENVPRRGAVVMFHGFGGCPQQFLKLGVRVAARGYDVLLPLLPGHGVLPAPDGADNLYLLPDAKDKAAPYMEFSARMNDIIRWSPGEKVVVGFSLGGAISLNAVLLDRRLYDRQLLLSPMFAVRGGAFVEGTVKVFGRIPAIKNIIVKPGAKRRECRGWQEAGRAGFCDYRLRHVIALLDLEAQNREMYQIWPFELATQIVAAGNEDYISNDEIVEFTQQQRKNGPISLCFLPEDVPHEMLSPYENSGQTMHWLNDLLKDAAAFISNQAFFPATDNSDSEQQPACDQSAA